MTKKKPKSKKESLEKRVAILEARVSEMGDRLERLELDNAVRIGDEQVARGEAIPVREAFENLRKKYKIPKTRSSGSRKSNARSTWHELSADEARHFHFG